MAFVDNNVVVACEMGWSIPGLFHNLQWGQIIWDTCSQIKSLIDLTPPLYQASCQFFARWWNIRKSQSRMTSLLKFGNAVEME